MNYTNKDTIYIWPTIINIGDGDSTDSLFDSRRKAMIFIARDVGHIWEEDISHLSLEELNLIIEDKFGKMYLVVLGDNDFTFKWVSSEGHIYKINKWPVL